ncbi:MAG: ATP-binding cassette domain-containing protein, partial [Candidatus Cloacimonetes bacterium]|nr:ATP-binding cassette domain-containing protein [Candidatus Cloacimonadota bacterium]
MNKIFCRIKNLSFAFDKKVVLDIPKLNLEAGKVYAFLGENGSGKTTLLKIISGLLESDGIQISGCSNAEDIPKKTIYVHQNPLLLKGSVFYNVS